MVNMNAATRGAMPGSSDRFPHFCVVWEAAEAEVGVWATSGDERDWIWRQRVSVIEEVANRAFDHARDEARGADLALDAVHVAPRQGDQGRPGGTGPAEPWPRRVAANPAGGSRRPRH
jgi:hypothetical protein